MSFQLVLLNLTEQWAAGFFEGEGYIGHIWLKNGPYRYPRLTMSVSQVCRQPLDAFREILDTGKVRGPYGPYNTTKQAYFQWCAHNESALVAIEKMIPYLFNKRTQAEKALNEYRKGLNERKTA